MQMYPEKVCLQSLSEQPYCSSTDLLAVCSHHTPWGQSMHILSFSGRFTTSGWISCSSLRGHDLLSQLLAGKGQYVPDLLWATHCWPVQAAHSHFKSP